MDEVTKNIENDIGLLEYNFQYYRLQDQDQYFQKLSILEHKEKVLIPLSFEIEEEYPIFENQFDSTQMKYCMAKKSIYEFSTATECLGNYQTYYLFYDPIDDYMEEFYSLDFQLYFHYED